MSSCWVPALVQHLNQHLAMRTSSTTTGSSSSSPVSLARVVVVCNDNSSRDVLCAVTCVLCAVGYTCSVRALPCLHYLQYLHYPNTYRPIRQRL